MNNKKKSIVIAVVFIIVFVTGYLLYNGLSPNTKEDIGGGDSGATAADFTVYDVSGDAVSLSDYSGKPVVVNFWASWCGPCKNELPHFQAAYDKYGEDIQFMMVNLTGGGTDSRDASDVVISENNYNFPVYYDNDSSAAESYDVSSIPVTCFIDSEGNIVEQVVGGMDEDRLEKHIGNLLNTKK